MDSALQQCLETVQSANLPEGDYLKVCAALKKSFEECKKKDAELVKFPLNIQITNHEWAEDCIAQFKFTFLEAWYLKKPYDSFLHSDITFKINYNFSQEGELEGEGRVFEVPMRELKVFLATILGMCSPESVWIDSMFGAVHYERSAVFKQMIRLHEEAEESYRLYDTSYNSEFGEKDNDDFYFYLYDRVIKIAQIIHNLKLAPPALT